MALYRGWVPNATGRLSFRAVGNTNFPTPAVCGNDVVDDHRYIVGYQCRFTSDSALQYSIPVFRANAKWLTFVVAARVCETALGFDQPLRGKIFVLVDPNKWELSTKSQVEGVANLLGDRRPKLIPQNGVDILREFKSLMASLRQCADVTISFTLHRDGCVVFHKPRFLDPDVYSHSKAFAQALNRNVDQEQADQAYFFLRDLAHRHQHHTPNAESILSLQEYPESDLGWASKVVFSLYLSIVTAKRGNGAEDNADALGILAYAKSFKAAIKRRADDALFNCLFPEFNDEALKDSIAASRDKLHIAQQARQQNWMASRTILIAAWALFMAIVSALFALKPEGATTDVFTTCALKSAMAHFSNWFLIALIIAIFLSLVRRLRLRSLKRVLLGLDQGTATATLMVGAISVLGLAIVVVRWIEGVSVASLGDKFLLAPILSIGKCFM